MTRLAYNYDSGAVTKAVLYAYDAASRLTQKTASSGTSVAYAYDLAGLVTLVTEGGNARGTYYYDAAGRRTHLVYGSMSYTDYVYDPRGALTLLASRKSDATDVSTFGYYLDAMGMRTKMDIGGSAFTAASVAYSYDSAYELTKEARTGGLASTKTSWYDNSGNRTKMDAGGTATTYDYDYIDRMTRAGGTQYQWDTWGNLTQSGVAYNYYWDDADRLTKFDGAGTQYDTTYNYEPGSWQRFKQNKNGTVTYFAWDGDELDAEYDGSGNLTRGYVTPGLDDHLALNTGGSTYYYLQDGLGSVRNVVDSSQVVQDTYDYDAWGNDIGNTSNVANPMQYTGAYRDSYSGPMYYMRNRYYVPAVATFASEDSIEASSTRDLTYAVNNPVAHRDPMGRNIYVQHNPGFGDPIHLFHLMICVDTWDGGCKGPKFCNGYGGTAQVHWFWVSTHWLHFHNFRNTSTPGPWIVGEIVLNPDNTGRVVREKATTRQEDLWFQTFLVSVQGEQDTYILGFRDCQTYANKEFDNAPGTEK